MLSVRSERAAGSGCRRRRGPAVASILLRLAGRGPAAEDEEVEPVAHFGLGEAGGPVATEVSWPGGTRTRDEGLEPDRRYLVAAGGAAGEGR